MSSKVGSFAYVKRGSMTCLNRLKCFPLPSKMREKLGPMVATV